MAKPKKPHHDFPLFAHANGQWAKKFYVRGKHSLKYFGPWTDDPKGERAIRDYVARKDAIRAGLDNLRAATHDAGLTLAQMIRDFLSVKHQKMLNGELADDTFNDYVIELQNLCDAMGADADVAAIGPDHFTAYLNNELMQRRKLGPHRRATVIRYVRALFNYAGKQGWIKAPDGHPRAVIFGADFVPPNTDPDAIAAQRMRKGEDVDDDAIYTKEMIEWMLDNAPCQFVPIILVMVNCGMGSSDLARLKWKHLDFESGRLSMRRGKNGIRRECYLWKRTRKALRRLLTLRHTAADIKANGDEALVFRTRKNQPFVRRDRIMKDGRVVKVKRHNAISVTVGRLVKKAKVAKVIPQKTKLTAYNFRHTYFTYAENHPDLNAVHRTMGHALQGMGRRYKRKPFPLPRLKRVALRVLNSIWPKPKPTKQQHGHGLRIAGATGGGKKGRAA